MGFDQNKSYRYYRRRRLVFQIKTFYLKKKLKNGELIDKEEAKDFFHSLTDNAQKIARKQLTAAQMDYIAKIDNPNKIQYYLNQMMKAALWELSSDKAAIQFSKLFKTSPEAAQKLFLQFAQGLQFKPFPKESDRAQNIEWYREQIINILENTEERLKPVLDEIKKVCEYDAVLAAIESCIHINTLPKRDSQQIHNKKRSFYKKKSDILDFLKEQGVSKATLSEIEALEFKCKDDMEWANYERTLKMVKSILKEDLINLCGTGKKRANEIAKIIDYI